MRILHVIPSFAPAWRYGGPIRAAYEMCRELAALGHQVDVMTTNANGKGFLEVPLGRPVPMDGFHVIYYPLQLPRIYAYSRELGLALQERVRDYDAVHIHSLFLWPTSAAIAACRRHRVPYILRPAGSLDPICLDHRYDPWHRAWLSRLKKWVHFQTIGREELAGAAALHFTSEPERHASQRHVDQVPAYVVPLGVRPEAVSTQSVQRHWSWLLRKAAGRKILLYLSRLDSKKGLDRTIAALSKLGRAREDFIFAVAGDGKPRFREVARRLIDRGGLAARTHWLGWVGGEAKWALFKTADIFILTSHHENFGLAAVEAMAGGLPVILSRNVNISGVVLQAGAGICVDLQPAEIEAALTRLLDDAALRAAMGSRARLLAEGSFSCRAAALQTIAMYRSVIAGCLRPGHGASLPCAA